MVSRMSADLAKPPPYEFHAGSLHIRKEDVWHRIDAWPEVRAFQRRPDAPDPAWAPNQPVFRLVLPYRRAAKREKVVIPDAQLELNLDVAPPNPPTRTTRGMLRKRAFDCFRFALPKPVARAVEPFPGHHYCLLQLLRRDPGLTDLLDASPALAFGLAVKAASDRANQPAGICELDLLLLSRLKQAELAEMLRFPNSKSALKFLSRIDPRALQPSVIEQLAIRLEAAPELPRTLSHVTGMLHAGVVGLLLDAEILSRCQPSLLREVGGDRRQLYRADTATLLEDILIMEEVLGRREQASFRSMARVRQAHDTLAMPYSQIQASYPGGELRFPRPPLPGIPRCIEPLCNPRDLQEEGAVQRHCVATYAQRVASGGWFIYRVLAPDRATLSICRGADGRWEIEQLNGKANAPVASRTHQIVRAWLERHDPA